MPNSKISNLTTATTPLAGTEVLPIVQSGVTKQVSVDNLTAGKLVSALTLDTTNLEVTNLKAKDGTAAGSIADSTGVVTLGSSVLTTTDINGGTIDNASVGASTASTGKFTTLEATSTTTLKPDGTNAAVTVDTNGLRSGYLADRMQRLAATNICYATGIKRSTTANASTVSFTLSCDAQASVYRHGFIWLVCSSQDSGTAGGNAAWFLLACRSSLADAFPVINTTPKDSGGDIASYTITAPGSGVLQVDAAATHDNLTVKIEFCIGPLNNVNIT